MVTHQFMVRCIIILIYSGGGKRSCVRPLLKDKNDVRAAKLKPRYLLTLVHVIVLFDAEIDGRHLGHSDGKDGNKTVCLSSVNDDATSPLHELVARFVFSVGLCFRRVRCI